MLEAAMDWLDDYDANGMVFLRDGGAARKHIAALVVEVTRLRNLERDMDAEIAKLREDKRETIRKAWRVSGAWTVGNMDGFHQRHPNLDEYLKRELGE
jgi:hypothetical protein